MIRSTFFKLAIFVASASLISGGLPTGARFWEKKPSQASGTLLKEAKPAGRAEAEMTRLPLSFEPNRGQTAPPVRFLARTGGFTTFLTDSAAIFRLLPEGAAGVGPAVGNKSASVLKMSFPGSNSGVSPEGLGETSGRVNYLIGNDPKRWITGIESVSRVRYRGLYPNTDLVFYGSGRKLEYDFVVRPGGDPGRINLAFEGAKSLRVDRAGDLVVGTAAGPLVQRRPVIYQRVDGHKRRVQGEFYVEGRRAGFKIGRYDRGLPLVIDPILEVSSFLGGSGEDQGWGLASDGAGNIYVTGDTLSSDFPVENAFQATQSPASREVFVTKIAEDSGMVYSTYIGGAELDAGRDIAINSSGNAFVTGVACSTNFPTQSAYQSSMAGTAGACDAFLTKLSSSGSSLVYSTYLGASSGHTAAQAVAVDGSGNAYIAGTTLATNFPTSGAAQGSNAGGIDAFITKFNSSASSLSYSTYLGGSGADFLHDMALDSSGNAHLTGTTCSSDFPTASPYQSALGGPCDAYVSKLNAAGSSVAYSTYLGGSGEEEGRGVALDSSGNTYLTGTTKSTNFPTQSPIQASQGGAGDAFVTKINSPGSSLGWSTYLGGVGFDIAKRVGLDSSGNVYLAGATASADFPSTAGFQTASGGGIDAFVTRLASSGSAIDYSSFLGGNATDEANALAVDSAGNAYVTGYSAFGETNSFPLVAPVDDVWAEMEAFVAKVGPGTAHYSNYWSATGDLLLPRFSHTATTLADGRVLVAGGCAVPASPQDEAVCQAETSSAEVFAPSTEAWLPAAPMSSARSSHTATRLADGRVLVVGGCLPPSQTIACRGNPSAEVYDPAVGIWVPAAPMGDGRTLHTATLLSNGGVLVAGGRSGSSTLSSAEVFDPTTGFWSSVGSMGQSRHGHSAVSLPDGRVLVSGGESGAAFLSSAEIFDPASGLWTATGSFPSGRSRHSMTALGNGQVLVAGGSNSASSTRSSLLWDAISGTWTSSGALRLARSAHAAVLLDSRRVLVAGGRTAPGVEGRARPSAEIYDSSSGNWLPAITMLHGRSGSRQIPRGHTLSLLPDGRALVVGGIPGVQTELFAAQADLSVGLSASPDPVSVGEDLTYSATVTNGGFDSGSGITLSLTVPAGASFVSANASQGTCTASAGSVTCALGELLKGDTAEVDVVIEPNLVGFAMSSVTVGGNEGDPYLMDNSASASATVLNSEGCTLLGTGSSDILVGTGGNDVICGLGGNDSIQGLGGDDILLGGSGNDVIDGGGGADVIRGGKGDDDLSGGMGTDEISGDAGADLIEGNGGDDNLDGSDGVSSNDTLDGGSGSDTCSADSGDGLTSC